MIYLPCFYNSRKIIISTEISDICFSVKVNNAFFQVKKKKSVLVLTVASLKSFKGEILALGSNFSTIKYCLVCCVSCILQDALKTSLVYYFSEFTSLLRKQMYCKTLKVLSVNFFHTATHVNRKNVDFSGLPHKHP